MRGVDTNVLLRIVLFDDSEQAGLVSRLLRRQQRRRQPLLVTGLALCEFVWVLRGRYGYDRAQQLQALRLIVDADQVTLDQPILIQRALERFEAGPADFADYLIGEISLAADCDDVVTFDRRLSGAEGFTLLG